MIKIILSNPYLSSLIVLIAQLIFIYLKTVNVIYISERKLIPAILSGNCIGLSWLISMSVGISSILNGELLPISAFLIGGSIGTYLGIKKEKVKNNE